MIMRKVVGNGTARPWGAQARPVPERWQAPGSPGSFAAMRAAIQRAAALARAVIVVVCTTACMAAYLTACLWPRLAWSQQAGSVVQPELRADLVAARSSAVQLGVGAVAPAGEYLRLGGDLGAGVAGGTGGPFFSTRADVYGRFHLDPRGESQWAPYLVAGGSLRADQRARGRMYALAAVGVEGPVSRPVVPAFELGLGGGVRAGIVLRRGLANRR
jgi:hypothetical protein